MALAAEKCAPCKGEEEKLSSKEVLETIKQVKDWRLQTMETEIFRDFSFKNFAEAWKFVQKVSSLAEEQGHHPDISFGWGYAEIVLTTHRAGGLTRNDFILAAKIDGLAQTA